MATINYPELATTLNLSDPVTLTHMREMTKAKPRFLLRHLLRIAPTDLIRTDTLLIDVKDAAGNELAPFVATGHKSIERGTYQTKTIKPARIAPSRTITLADTATRIWLEGIADPKTREERAMQIAIDDMSDLVDRTENTWEKMIADMLQNGEYTYTNEKSDKNGADENTDTFTVSWADTMGDANWKFTPGTTWDTATANILGDLQAMARTMRGNGVQPTVALVGSEAAAAILNNEKIAKLLDNRRIEIGGIAPRIVQEGGAVYGQLIVDGLNIQLVDYAGMYVGSDKQTKPLIDPKKVVLTTEGAVRGIFADVTQIEDCGKNFVTHLAPMVPKYYSDVENDIFKLMMTSRPAFAPSCVGSFVSATVLG